MGANPLEGTACANTAACGAGSGLECLGGFCAVRCTTPDERSNCREGQLCLTLAMPADTNVCITLPARDQSCAAGRCADGLECRAANYDDNGVPVRTAPFFDACQQPCAPATNQGCGQGERCYAHPGLEGFGDVQLTPQGTRVTCTTPGSSQGCNSALGFECRMFGSGTFCARDFGFCGAGIAPWNFALPFSSEENLLCNWGPALRNMSGQTIQDGSVGCTPVTEDPSATFCARRPLESVWEGPDLANFPGLGLCMGVCDLASATTPRVITACNPGFFCDYTRANAGVPTPQVDCTQGGQAACDAVDTKLVCVDVPNSSARTCVYRFGVCQPT